MKHKPLVITKLKKDLFDPSFSSFDFLNTYNFSSGTLNRGESISLNDAKKLHIIAEKQINKYADFIYSTNNFFLKNGLVFNKNLSLYFLSLHSNKRSELFSTFNDYLHQLLLRDILSSKGFDDYYAIGFSKEEITQMENSLGIKFKIRHLTKNKKRISHKLMVFYLFSFFYLIVIKLLFNRRKKRINEFFVAQYPMHFNGHFIHSKYGELNEKERKVYLLTLLSDGFHQSLKPLSFIKSIFQLTKRSNINRYIILDRYVSWNDFFGALFFQFELKKKFRSFRKENLSLEGIDLSYQIDRELKLSTIQIPRLLMYFNSYMTVFSLFSPEKVTYYLHEFVSGRFISYIINTYFPKTISLGFQHGPIAELKSLYVLSSKEVSNKDYLYSVPLPQKNICESDSAKSIYKSFGYQNLEVMSNVKRLSYLKSIKRKNIQKESCLIVCGLHDPDLLFQYVIKKKIYSNKKIWFKLHPMTKEKHFRKLINNIGSSNIHLATKPLPFYLENIEEVIVTYSSVGAEAIQLGIKTTLIVFGFKINESPLMDDNSFGDKLNIEYIN